MSIDVTFFEATPFSLSFLVTSQRVGDDFLVYTISSPVPLAPLDPTPAPVPVKPPITQVYSRCQTLQSLVQHWLLHHQIQSRMMIFQLLFVKVNVSVLTQSLCLFLINICHFPLVPLLHTSIDSISLPNIVCEALSHHG